MPKLQVNGIEIAYDCSGSGEALLLIAGLGYDRWMWHRMVPGLARHFNVITFDNRGVGESSKPEGPYTVEMLAEDTAGLLEGLGLEHAIVLGHSMGGFVAQALALDRPELVRKLILSATNFGGPRHIPPTPEAMAILLDVTGDAIERLRRGILVSCAPDFGQAQPEMVQAWLEYRIRNPVLPGSYQAQLAIGLALLSQEACFEGKLKQVQAPTLILFGEHDQVVPPGNAELLAKEIPNSTVKILPDAGHFFPIETPAAAMAAVVEFVSQRR